MFICRSLSQKTRHKSEKTIGQQLVPVKTSHGMSQRSKYQSLRNLQTSFFINIHSVSRIWLVQIAGTFSAIAGMKSNFNSKTSLISRVVVCSVLFVIGRIDLRPGEAPSGESTYGRKDRSSLGQVRECPQGSKAHLLPDFFKVLRFSFPVPVVGPSSPFRFCRRKHKKSTVRTWRSWKNLSSTCRQV